MIHIPLISSFFDLLPPIFKNYSCVKNSTPSQSILSGRLMRWALFHLSYVTCRAVFSISPKHPKTKLFSLDTCFLPPSIPMFSFLGGKGGRNFEWNEYDWKRRDTSDVFASLGFLTEIWLKMGWKSGGETEDERVQMCLIDARKCRRSVPFGFRIVSFPIWVLFDLPKNKIFAFTVSFRERA